MNIKNRILIQTLGASLSLILVLGALFFISVAGIRNMAVANSNDLGDSAAYISGNMLEIQLTETISRIARDMAFILNERMSGIGQHARMDAAAESFRADLAQIVNASGIENRVRVFVLNRDGIKVYASDGVIGGESFLASPDDSRLRSLGLSMTLGATGMTELVMDGIPVYAAYAPIAAIGWSLGVAVSVQEVYASAMFIENQIWQLTDSAKAEMDRSILFSAGVIAALLAVILAGIAVFAIRFTHAITGPILALNNGVREVAGGNLEREVAVKTGDELEQLAASFNMMTGQLRRHIEEIAKVTAERQRIDTELDIATRIQMSMLPDNFPPFRGRKNEFDLYAQVHPAREVGGDFYDFFFVDDDHLALVVADVSGKGIPAALFMAISKTIIKNHLQRGGNPELAMDIINRQLCDNNITDMFVTVWLCVLEIASGRLVYINAGHNPPLLRNDAGGFTYLVSPPDLVLAGMNDTRYHSRQIQIKPGDTLFLYTDGIVEAADTAGGFYGKERLKAFLDANAGLSLQDLLCGLRADIAGFAGGAEQSDDITMLAIRIGGPADTFRAVTLKADLAELDALITFIGKELDTAGCPQKERGQIELAAEEIFVNIANYAYREQGTGDWGQGTRDKGQGKREEGEGRREEGEVRVGCRLQTDADRMTLTVTFSDNGQPFNPLEHADPDTGLPLEKREAGGLGILIVKKTMDILQYSREEETNSLEFAKSWQKEKV